FRHCAVNLVQTYQVPEHSDPWSSASSRMPREMRSPRPCKGPGGIEKPLHAYSKSAIGRCCTRLLSTGSPRLIQLCFRGAMGDGARMLQSVMPDEKNPPTRGISNSDNLTRSRYESQSRNHGRVRLSCPLLFSAWTSAG